MRSGSQTGQQGRQILPVSLTLSSPGSSWEIPIGGNRGRGRHQPQRCMRLITFMEKTPEIVGSEIQKVLEPSWIIQVCSCAGGQGVPMVGFFTCWDLPQKCVLTIL